MLLSQYFLQKIILFNQVSFVKANIKADIKAVIT